MPRKIKRIEKSRPIRTHSMMKMAADDNPDHYFLEIVFDDQQVVDIPLTRNYSSNPDIQVFWRSHPDHVQELGTDCFDISVGKGADDLHPTHVRQAIIDTIKEYYPEFNKTTAGEKLVVSAVQLVGACFRG